MRTSDIGQDGKSLHCGMSNVVVHSFESLAGTFKLGQSPQLLWRQFVIHAPYRTRLLGRSPWQRPQRAKQLSLVGYGRVISACVWCNLATEYPLCALITRAKRFSKPRTRTHQISNRDSLSKEGASLLPETKHKLAVRCEEWRTGYQPLVDI